MDVVDADNIRHKREEEARRAKRKEARGNKSAAQLEKEARRKEHAKRVLQQQKGLAQTTAPATSLVSSGDESKFQALFQKRAEGFLVDFMFRNAPPRPPVGPCFVGLGLDGELNDKWTRYKPRNAMEVNHVWKLHVEPDLGVPLASTAMQLDLYVNPVARNNTQEDHPIDESMFGGGEKSAAQDLEPGSPEIHPDDLALIQWKGSLGDTAGEALQLRRDYARAAARMHYKSPHATRGATNTSSQPNNRFKVKQNQGAAPFTSRVLQERNPHFMRKTTYLSNDTSQSVHSFKSLAQTRLHLEQVSAKRLRDAREQLPANEFIEQTFDIARQYTAFYDTQDPNENRDTTSPAKKKARTHPTKSNVVAMAEYPLFPNTKTWDKSCVHVAMDHLPKKVGEVPPPSYAQMQKAMVMDVRNKDPNLSARMECNVLVPKQTQSDDTATKIDLVAAHMYDLEVVHVKEHVFPFHNTFLFVMDKTHGVATYHPISSRVNLSSGRPISAAEKNRKNALVVQTS